MKASLSLLVMAAAVLSAHAQDSDRKVPKIVKGQLVDPVTPPPAPKSYPRISGEGTDRRLEINKDVSVGGNASPNSVSGNVQFPIPEKKK